jgi:hypothetical protein
MSHDAKQEILDHTRRLEDNAKKVSEKKYRRQQLNEDIEEYKKFLSGLGHPSPKKWAEELSPIKSRYYYQHKLGTLIGKLDSIYKEVRLSKLLSYKVNSLMHVYIKNQVDELQVAQDNEIRLWTKGVHLNKSSLNEINELISTRIAEIRDRLPQEILTKPTQLEEHQEPPEPASQLKEDIPNPAPQPDQPGFFSRLSQGAMNFIGYGYTQ